MFWTGKVDQTFIGTNHTTKIFMTMKKRKSPWCVVLGSFLMFQLKMLNIEENRVIYVYSFWLFNNFSHLPYTDSVSLLVKNSVCVNKKIIQNGIIQLQAAFHTHFYIKKVTTIKMTGNLFNIFLKQLQFWSCWKSSFLSSRFSVCSSKTGHCTSSCFTTVLLVYSHFLSN